MKLTNTTVARTPCEPPIYAIINGPAVVHNTTARFRSPQDSRKDGVER